MRKIFKYPLNDKNTTVITLPKDYQIVKLSVTGMMFPCIWAMVNPTQQETVDREFKIFGTGDEIPPHWQYLDTFFHQHYVWHVFENSLLF